MGMNVGGGSGGAKSDINVTPLVDVCLVLLIIFMTAMPLLMRNITIEIPRKLDAAEVVMTSSTTLTVCGKADGTVIINDGSSDSSVNRVELANTIRPMLEKKRTEKIVFVDFEDQVKYADAVSIMDTLYGLGKLVDPETDKTRTRDVKIALKIREEINKNDPCRPPE